MSVTTINLFRKFIFNNLLNNRFFFLFSISSVGPSGLSLLKCLNIRHSIIISDRLAKSIFFFRCFGGQNLLFSFSDEIYIFLFVKK